MLLWIFVHIGMSGFLIKVRMRCNLSQIDEQSDADQRVKYTTLQCWRMCLGEIVEAGAIFLAPDCKESQIFLDGCSLFENQQ